MTRFYRFNGAGGLAFGGFQWPLPTEGGPGEWVAVVGHESAFPAEFAALHGAVPGRVLAFCWVARAANAARAAGRVGEVELYEVEAHPGYPIDVEDGIMRMRVGRLVRRITTWSDQAARLAVVDAVDLLRPGVEVEPAIGRIADLVRAWADDPAAGHLDVAHAAALRLSRRLVRRTDSTLAANIAAESLEVISRSSGVADSYQLPAELAYGEPLAARLGLASSHEAGRVPGEEGVLT